MEESNLKTENVLHFLRQRSDAHTSPNGTVYTIPCLGATGYINYAGYDAVAPFSCYNRKDAVAILNAIKNDPTAVGVVVLGGGDICPEIYGEKPHPNTFAGNPEQDLAEMMVIRHSPVPVLGICRGLQLIHCALSKRTQYARLEQHLTRHLSEQGYRGRWGHGIGYLKDFDITGYKEGEVYQVNSLHHQGVVHTENSKEEFPYMDVIATSISAEQPVVELAMWENVVGVPCLGIQSHPEMMYREVEKLMMNNLFGSAALE